MSGKHTLVTFLHVANDRSRSGEPPEFFSANYDFGEQRVRTERLFGLALLGHLIDRGAAPDRLVILGTPGSSWGRLMAYAVSDADAGELEQLDKSSRESKVSGTDLEHWVRPLEAGLRQSQGAPALSVNLVVTGYASDEEGQREMIALIGQHVDDGGLLTIDATHSLRHLPLLGVFSAMALRRLKDAALSGVYYGALDRRELEADGQFRTPVWRLDGLPLIADWLSALSAFDKDGDYGVFAPLLVRAGIASEVAGNLADAAFNELIGNFEEASRRLKNFRKTFATCELKGAAALFKDELMSRTAWVESGGGLYEKQRHMARAALERDDAVRAATWGYEAVNTRLALERRRDPLQSYNRKWALNDYRENAPYSDQRKAFDRLEIMRHQIAHAGFKPKTDDPVHSEVLGTMSRRESCLEALRDYLGKWLPDLVEWH